VLPSRVTQTQALLQLTHAAKHADGIAVNVEWTRQDAVAAIRMI